MSQERIDQGTTPAATPSAPLAVLRDEAELRSLFDRDAAALVAAAIAKLADSPFLAPRVVEQAFVHAWHSRAHIASATALDAFLRDEVEHGAARALSRQLAAHRMGHHGNGARATGHARPDGSYDHATSWSHVLQGVRADVRSAEAHDRAAAIAHHEAAAHIKEVTRHGGWVRPTLVGAATVAFALAMVWMLDSAGAQSRLRNAVTTGPVRTVAASAGQLGALELADGSAVRLAPETNLAIPEKFGADLRGVSVAGAARIRVAAGAEEPLTVIAGPASIASVAGEFSIRAYPGEGGTVVVVHDGGATVRVGEASHTVAAGASLFVPDSGAARAATDGQVAEATSWSDNVYVATDRRIGDVLTDLQRWYRTQIFAVDPEVLDRRISIRASLDSVRQAIAAIEQAGGVQFGYMNEKMVFTDRAAAAPRGSAR